MQISVPRFTLPNGRSARRVNVTYVPQKYLEMVLFNRTDGGSSGAIYKILGRTGQDKTAWLINKAAVQSNELSQAHADFIMQTFKDLMPSNDDAVLGGRTRNVTLLPLRTAIIVCQTRGRSPSTTAFLRACAPDDCCRCRARAPDNNCCRCRARGGCAGRRCASHRDVRADQAAACALPQLEPQGMQGGAQRQRLRRRGRSGAARRRVT